MLCKECFTNSIFQSSAGLGQMRQVIAAAGAPRGCPLRQLYGAEDAARRRT
jgi:hypothetical protein